MPDHNLDPINKSPPALVFDLSRYHQLLDDPDITLQESEAFLKAMWDLMVLVFDFGLRVEFAEIDPQASQKRSKEMDAAIASMVSSEHSDLSQQKLSAQDLEGAGEGRLDGSI